jgi:hypothetical protein
MIFFSPFRAMVLTYGLESTSSAFKRGQAVGYSANYSQSHFLPFPLFLRVTKAYTISSSPMEMCSTQFSVRSCDPTTFESSIPAFAIAQRLTYPQTIRVLRDFFAPNNSHRRITEARVDTTFPTKHRCTYPSSLFNTLCNG